MTWLLVGSLLPSLATSCLLAAWIRRRALGWGLLDQPGARKVHVTPTPLGGGLAIWAGVVLPLAVGQALLAILHAARSGHAAFQWAAQFPLPEIVERHLPGLWQESIHLWALLAAGTVLMVLGLIDDVRGVDWRVRIGVQTLVAAAMVWGGWKLTLFLDVPLLTDGLSVLWIVGLVNSFNMLDNMDGLSGGVAAIAATILAAVMLTAPFPAAGEPQLFIGGLLLVLVGSLLGFLWHNRPPARIFMGDAGAYFIGFLLAICTIMATFAGDATPRHALLVPICVLAIPLYDMVSVIFIRLVQRRSLFTGDKSHFSHRLVDLGLSKPKAVGTIYLATATTGLGALLLYQVDALGAAIVVAMVACVLMLIAVLEIAGHSANRD